MQHHIPRWYQRTRRRDVFVREWSIALRLNPGSLVRGYAVATQDSSSPLSPPGPLPSLLSLFSTPTKPTHHWLEPVPPFLFPFTSQCLHFSPSDSLSFSQPAGTSRATYFSSVCAQVRQRNKETEIEKERQHWEKDGRGERKLKREEGAPESLCTRCHCLPRVSLQRLSSEDLSLSPALFLFFISFIPSLSSANAPPRQILFFLSFPSVQFLPTATGLQMQRDFE